jgi:hypothetical protein
MSILLFFVALIIGFVSGRVSVRNDYEKERLALDKIDEDVAYYKKLTRDLVAENKSIRIELDGYESTKSKKR